MSAIARLLDSGLGPSRRLRVLAASGQLGYGIPERAFRAGLARKPHFIGCDMGSIDVGPYYLGSGQLATSERITRRDLRLVLHGALAADVPLIIGTAGTAGAAPHLERTLGLIRSIAMEDGLTFRLATIQADMPRELLKRRISENRTRPLGPIEPLSEPIVDRASNIVAQMGVGAFLRAIDEAPDVIVAGRACDTAVFAALPQRLGYPVAAAMHMAKIIECTSLCCVPGGRDAILATLSGDRFVVESMNPGQAATPLSVAAHSLYEQADPLTVHEPEGTLHLEGARFEALDDRRTTVYGAMFEPASVPTVKVEGAEWCGERAVLAAGSADPRVMENVDAIVESVRATVQEFFPAEDGADFQLIFHMYGHGGVSLFPRVMDGNTSELLFLVECIAEDKDQAHAVISVTKQYLLHHGFPGRLSTGGNIAFPFTPAELPGGTAYRFSIHHLVESDPSDELFGVQAGEVH